MYKSCLIIDNHLLSAETLTRIIASTHPNFRVGHYNPEQSGWPEDVDWKHYQIIFMARELGQDSGLEWFRVLKTRHKFPDCVLLDSGGGSDAVKTVAFAMGIKGYLEKAKLTELSVTKCINQLTAQNKESSFRSKDIQRFQHINNSHLKNKD